MNEKFELLYCEGDISLKSFQKIYNSKVFQSNFFNPVNEIIYGWVYYNLDRRSPINSLSKLVKLRKQFLDSVSDGFVFWWMSWESTSYRETYTGFRRYPDNCGPEFLFQIEFWVVVKNLTKFDHSEFFKSKRIMQYNKFWRSEGYGTDWIQQCKSSNPELFPGKYSTHNFRLALTKDKQIFLTGFYPQKSKTNSMYDIFGCNKVLLAELKQTRYKSAWSV